MDFIDLLRKRKTAMRKGNFYPKGVTAIDQAFQFVFQTEGPAQDIQIKIYAGEKELMCIPVPDSCRHGWLYSIIVEDIPKTADSYCYYTGTTQITDPYARGVLGMNTYGREKKELRYILPKDSYDWEEDVPPGHSFENTIIYGLHVRGFTKHPSSGVRKKGTFAGIQEKLPYLKELGITAVELMPACEFDEFEHIEGQYLTEDTNRNKINYWGFKPAYYYAPKSAYACGKNAAAEMKDMIRALHQANIEILMQFYFPEEYNIGEIPDILHFWVEEYHIDGFHLTGKRLPPVLLAADPFLKDTKLIFEHITADEIRQETDRSGGGNLAFWQESFSIDMRGALKGDGGCLNPMLFHLRHNEEKAGVINAIAGYNGFTLMDLVSYERKHNEPNGEDNRDGTDHNFSWNCGIEGKTRKRTVQLLRHRQIRNALALVFLSQGTPYLQSGDEFGQTQDGNNNPYCQDNKVTWLDWKLLHTHRTLFDFTRALMALRRAHGVFHREQPLRGMDYMGYGCPDISFHGEEAWRPSFSYHNRHTGVMYCGKYAKDQDGLEDASFYVAYNMHWEPHEFALPKISRHMCWQLCMDTASPEMVPGTEKVEAGSVILAGERSIRVYVAVKK